MRGCRGIWRGGMEDMRRGGRSRWVGEATDEVRGPGSLRGPIGGRGTSGPLRERDAPHLCGATELNATAAAGHIVAVTRPATDRSPNSQLAAILAHELGHHVGGHPWAAMLADWYALPARTVGRWIFAGLTGLLRSRNVAGVACGGCLSLFILWFLYVYTFEASMWWLVLPVTAAPLLIALAAPPRRTPRGRLHRGPRLRHRAHVGPGRRTPGPVRPRGTPGGGQRPRAAIRRCGEPHELRGAVAALAAEGE
ncbi:M48 family metalloprotease [Streptomyces sp. NPDC001262]|uniref:M48 family metalloprotease n=1 Tax=Streptomyces sp. NPDC001262 TaxID=3364552 RepID=UPI0036BF3365